MNVDSFARYGFRLDTGEQSGATLTSVSPGYFSTIGARVVFGPRVHAAGPRRPEQLAVVNEELRTKLWRSVLGGRPAADGRRHGHAENHRRGSGHAGDGSDPTTPHPQVFWLSRGSRAMTLVVRVSGAARERIAVIRSAVQAVDPKVPVFNVKTMDERLDSVLARPKFYTTAVVFFGGLGLLLAVIGVYGVVSHAVVQRTREMGIRLALGTTPGRLRARLLRQTLVTIGAGGAGGSGGWSRASGSICRVWCTGPMRHSGRPPSLSRSRCSSPRRPSGSPRTTSRNSMSVKSCARKPPNKIRYFTRPAGAAGRSGALRSVFASPHR